MGDLGSVPELRRSPGEGNSYPIQYSGLENFMDCRIHGGEGNGNPLQYSCLENPVDRGAWWAATYGVTQSWTRLKWVSSSSSSSRVHGVAKSPTRLNNFHFQTLGSVFYTFYISIIFWCIQWSRLVFSQIQQNHFVLYFPSSHPSPQCYFSGIFRIWEGELIVGNLEFIFCPSIIWWESTEGILNVHSRYIVFYHFFP